MRQLFVMAILLITSLAASAQKETTNATNSTSKIACAEIPQTIETFIANSHEAEWYGAQAQAWQKVVDENPKDEWAWRNLFRATNYYDMFTDGFGDDQDQSRTADVLRKIEAAFPDSYLLNLCK